MLHCVWNSYGLYRQAVRVAVFVHADHFWSVCHPRCSDMLLACVSLVGYRGIYRKEIEAVDKSQHHLPSLADHNH